MRRTLIVAAVVLVATATAAGATADNRPSHQDTGGKIVLTSNRTGQDEIVVANADGTGRVDLNAQGRSPEFSPDGRRIAFASVRDGNSEIYVMNADGSNQTRLTFNTLYDSRPQWAADGRKLVFTRITADGNWDIFRMNADGSNEVDLTNNPAFEWGQSTLGDRIVFTREEGGVGHIFVMNIDGRGVRRITNTSSYDSYPNQSPRGDLVLFSRDTADGSGDDLWVTREDGRGERQRTHQSSTGYISEATWSPDGSRIMYSQCAPGGANPCALHLMNADGSGDRDISTPAAPLTETFDNGVTDGGLWHMISDPGGSLTTSNGRLVASISGSAVPGGQYDQVDEHIGSQCSLDGDFDYQVDYSLLVWPAFGGVYAQLSAFFADGGVARTSGPWDPPYNQQYASWINPNGGSINTTDTAGTFRLVRTAGTLYAYVRSASLPNWTLVNSGSAPNSTVFGMGLWAPGNQFQHQDATVAYDNFHLNSGALSCPTWWSDNFADWASFRGDR
jgi:Tol biopolymer transport system component